MTGPGDNSNAQLRSIVDRILRLKEEQDAIGADIRDVYAEAKANGFDKTGLGSLVSYLRRREKNPEKEAERSAIFDLYLSAYEGGSGPEKLNDFSRAHAHEENPSAPHPETVDGGQPKPSVPAETANQVSVNAGAKSSSDEAPSDAGQGTHIHGHGTQSAITSNPDDLEIPGFLDRRKQAGGTAA